MTAPLCEVCGRPMGDIGGCFRGSQLCHQLGYERTRSDLAAAEDDVAYLFACLGIAVAWGRRWKRLARARNARHRLTLSIHADHIEDLREQCDEFHFRANAAERWAKRWKMYAARKRWFARQYKGTRDRLRKALEKWVEGFPWDCEGDDGGAQVDLVKESRLALGSTGAEGVCLRPGDADCPDCALRAALPPHPPEET